MTWVVMLFMLLSGAVLQVLIPGPHLLGQAKAPLLLAVVLYYALTRETWFALVVALLAGVLQDAMSPVPMGYSASCFCFVGWAAGWFRNLVEAESLFTAPLFGAAAAGSVALFLYALLARAGLVSYALPQVALKIGGSAVLGAVAAPVVFKLSQRFDQMVGNVEVKEVIDGIDGPI